MFNRSRAIVVLTIATLFTAAFDNLIQRRFQGPGTIDTKAERRRQRQQARRQHYFARGSNNARMSGLGARECSRRRGGEDWQNFKTIDRARRGLS